MNWLDFLLLALASRAAVRTWFEGSLFEEVRGFLETKAAEPFTPPVELDQEGSGAEAEPEVTTTPLPWALRVLDRLVPCWAAELLSCPFCLSHHVPWILGAACYLPGLVWDLSPVAVWLSRLPVWSLAATEVTQILKRIDDGV